MCSLNRRDEAYKAGKSLEVEHITDFIQGVEYADTHMSKELIHSIIMFAANVSGKSTEQLSKKLDKLIKNNQFMK